MGETADTGTYKRLVTKSIEAFLVAVELYNKPTIRYRVEGFAFFICNAWELMLKAELIKRDGEQSVYFKDSPERTIPLSTCIARVFTNKKDPLRINLEKIVELRNTSTHFVTEEYELVYVLLFQSCLFNYVDKMDTLHSVDVLEVVPQNFLTLPINYMMLDANEVSAKYPKEIAQKILDTDKELSDLTTSLNDKFAIPIRHDLYLTRDKDKASAFVHIDKDAEVGVQVINRLKDPNNTHRYNVCRCVEEINKRLEQNSIPFAQGRFNRYHFGLFSKRYSFKNNEEYCYANTVNKNPSYGYSVKAIELVVLDIQRNPMGIINELKEFLGKNKG
jgi:hypothetical protein